MAAVDELNMSTLRLRLRYDDEPVTSNRAMKRVGAAKKKNEEEDEGDQEAEGGGDEGGGAVEGKRLANWKDDKFETIYILERFEVKSQRLKLDAEKTVSLSDFKKKHGQLMYLERLKTSATFKGSNENPEPCPICTRALGTEWSVLQCGHCFCCDCIRTLIDEYTVRSAHRASVRCAICRNLTFHGEISYVKTK